MANTVEIPKSYVILGLCLPLAVLLGYLLAEPLDLGSVAVVLLVFAVLSVPLLMKWHYPLLVFSWNAAISPIVLPGRPYLWMLMASIGLFFAVLNRSVNPRARFLLVPGVATPLLALTVIILVTAMLTGGIGLQVLGSDRLGGKKYLTMLVAVAGYFAFSSQRIPPSRASLYIAAFFLSGLTAMVGNLAVTLGPGSYFLLDFFSPDFAVEQATTELALTASSGMVRLTGLSWAAMALFFFLLARYGIRGVLDLQRPWRLAALLLCCGATLFGGFRSFPILFALTFALLFVIEGLHRTRYLAAIIGGALLLSPLLITQSDKLPLVAQRALSFLPLKIDPVARESATSSSVWRLEMWRLLLPEIPKYFFRGKGFTVDQRDLFMAQEAAARHFLSAQGAGGAMTGDFHSGPLSIIIPFGIFGCIAFVWLFVGGIKLLLHNFRYGDPALHTVNAFLLAAFLARLVFFVFVFGSSYSDLAIFTGLLGFSVALNGGDASLHPAQPPSPESDNHPFPGVMNHV